MGFWGRLQVGALCPNEYASVVGESKVVIVVEAWVKSIVPSSVYSVCDRVIEHHLMGFFPISIDISMMVCD